MPESSGNKHPDYSKFDNMNTEMLEGILRADSQLPSGEESDTDAILYIMEVIAKREKEHPTRKITDINDAWASFSKDYLPYSEDEKSLYDFDDIENQTGIKKASNVKPAMSPRKHRRLMRVACVTAAAIVLLMASTVTASAFGFDLWGAVAKWTKDTFGFSNTTTNAQVVQVASDKNSEYKNLQDALDNYKVTAKIAPTWLPEGYSLENIHVNETPAQTIINAKYEDAKNEILLKAILLNQPSTRTYEKDGDNVTEYTVDRIEHFIISNMGQTNIVWQTGNCECSITGSFTLNEAEKMIKSIYERK